MSQVTGICFQRNSNIITPNKSVGIYKNVKTKSMSKGMSKNPANSITNNVQSNTQNTKKELEKKLRLLSASNNIIENKDRQGLANNIGINAILGNSKKYVEQLRIQRQQNQATSLKVKKVKYRFKDISSRILRSKTSYAAKQAAGQARREVLRLKCEKRKCDGENIEELEAAIAHAKAMERVAKKKARYLLQEEMIKISDNPMEQQVDKENIGDIENDMEEYVFEDKKSLIDEENIDSEYELSSGEIEKLISKLSENMQMIIDNMNELSDAMFDDMEEMMGDMQDLLLDLGLGELTDNITPAGTKMSFNELKQLKILHRNKEMKEITKADAEYLKAIFESLEKGKTTGLLIDSSIKGIMPAQNITAQPAQSVQVMAIEPIINITL